MNEIQAHIVQLLGELDEICIRNQIPYILYGRTAKDACVSGTFCGEYMNASILIPAQYFPILEQQIQAQFSDRRGVEWVGNNPAFPGMHMRYVDEETTFIYGDSAHHYHRKGIYVAIERARYIPQKKINAKLANWIDKVIEYAGVEDITALSRKKQRAVQLTRLGMRCFGHKRMIRALLHLQEKLVSNPGKQIAVIRYLKDNLNLSENYLKAVKRIPFAGRSFFVPKKHEDYLNLVYGKNWKSKTPKDVAAPHLLVTSTEVSYRDLGVQIDQDKQAAISQIVQKRNSITKQIKQLKTEIEQYWNVLFITQCRYELYRKYYPRKDELLLALDKEEYGILQMVMQEALEAEEKYLKLGMVISLDSAIDQIIVRLLSYQGKYELAYKMEKLLSKVPQVPLEINVPSNDDDVFWPERISMDSNSDIPVYFRDTSGREYPVMWNVGNDLRGLLRISKNSLAASVAQGTLVAQDGKQLLSLEEIFTDKLGGSSYTTLMHRDFLGREYSVAALTRTGALYPMVAIDKYQVVHSIELPRICRICSDLSVPAQVHVYDKSVGEAYWKSPNGYISPALAMGVQGKLCLVPHYLDAELVYRDELGTFTPVQQEWYAPDPVKAQFLQAEGHFPCTLVQQDIFGRNVTLAEIPNSGIPLPCGRIDADGIFHEEAAAADEYILYWETSQQELLPLSKVFRNGGAIPTVYAAFLQEISGVCAGNTLPLKESEAEHEPA